VTAGQLRNFTAEELRELGFPLFSADTISKDLPTSKTQPVSFLVLETVEQAVRAGAGGPSEVDGHDTWIGTPATPARKLRNKLVPQFINSVCRSYFRISSHKEYASVLRKLLKRDPLLTFALQKAMRYLKAGENQSVSHVTPDPSGQTSSLFGMRITPCIWSAAGRSQAALLIEHNVPYNPAEVMPRLMRDYAVLSHVPAILTLIDFQGKVLYQNASSLAYMGDLLSVKYDNRLSEGLLRVLFMYDLHNLEQMLEDVLHGNEWQGVVQVPVSLRRYLAANHGSEMIDVNGSFTGAGPRPNNLNDDLDLDFQIGNSFTTRGLGAKHKKQQQKQTPGYLMGRAGPALQRNISVRESTLQQGRDSNGTPGGERSAGPGSVSGAQALAGHSNGSPGSAGPGRSSHAGDSHSPDENNSFTQQGMFGAQHNGANENQPQRKFMTLLDRADRNQRAAINTRTSVSVEAGAIVGNPNASYTLGADQPALPGQSAITPGPEADMLEPVDEDEDSYDEAQECYHEIHAIPLLDPVLDKQVIMLVQTDVTPRVELENKLADLTDAQLSMLEQLFPRHIIEYMLARVPSRGGRNLRDLANTHEQVMVLFCDVVGFTSMSKEVEPSQVMHFLNELYEGFDELVDEYDMYKLDIVGDCYIVVAGLIKEDQDGFVCVDEMDEDQVINNAVRIMQFAKAMLRESRPVLMPHNSEPVQLRIGIHTGPLVSGLVGAKMPKFTLFGDTINTASRMESTCRPGCVHVSDAFARLLPHEDWESTGGVQVKGKGMMQTYLWVPKLGEGAGGLSDLTEMDPESAVRNLRKSLSRMNSFTSVRSHRTVGGRGGDSRSSAGSAINPLVTILTNIRGGDDSDGGDLDRMGGDGGEGSGRQRSLARPVSARWSSVKHRQSHGGGGGLHSGDSDDGERPMMSSSRHNNRRPSEGFRLNSRRNGARRPSEGVSLRAARASAASGTTTDKRKSGHSTADVEEEEEGEDDDLPLTKFTSSSAHTHSAAAPKRVAAAGGSGQLPPRPGAGPHASPPPAPAPAPAPAAEQPEAGIESGDEMLLL